MGASKYGYQCQRHPIVRMYRPGIHYRWVVKTDVTGTSSIDIKTYTQTPYKMPQNNVVTQEKGHPLLKILIANLIRLFSTQCQYFYPYRYCLGFSGRGGGGSPLYKLYRYVLPHQVGFLRRFGQKMGHTLPILVWNQVCFSRELRECMNVFIVSIQMMSKKEREMYLQIRDRFE